MTKSNKVTSTYNLAELHSFFLNSGLVTVYSVRETRTTQHFYFFGMLKSEKVEGREYRVVQKGDEVFYLDDCQNVPERLKIAILRQGFVEKIHMSMINDNYPSYVEDSGDDIDVKGCTVS